MIRAATHSGSWYSAECTSKLCNACIAILSFVSFSFVNMVHASSEDPGQRLLTCNHKFLLSAFEILLATFKPATRTRKAAALEKDFGRWLATARVDQPDSSNIRAIVAPHAGYSYSGHVAAWAYKHLQIDNVRRIFILGPSHHVRLTSCALTECASYETPLGDLPIDQQTCKELADTGKFVTMKRDVDEDEHSIEMHLPFVRFITRNKDISIVPVMVGAIDSRAQREYSRIFAKYLADPHSFFVISTDFCHWGTRFGYTHIEPGFEHIHEAIERLDRRGMEAIERGSPKEFEAYLAETKNTICGRFPITVLLNAVESLRSGSSPAAESCDVAIRFVKYAQSSQVTSKRDSSVSYAAAYVTVDPRCA